MASQHHADTKDGALYFIEQTVPCILHLENHTLQKTLTNALVEDLSNAQGKHMYEYEYIRRMDEREQWFIEVVTEVMNKQILGSELNVAQWKLPVEKEKGEQRKIGIINIENYHGQIVMSKFDKLIEKCIAGEKRQRKLRYAVLMHNEVIGILCKKGDYMEAEKRQFQLVAD